VTEDVSKPALEPVDRPLALGEIFRAAAEIYQARVWQAFGLGLVSSATTLLSLAVDVVYVLPVVALGFTVSWALGALMATGVGLGEAWRVVVSQAPTLLILTLLVTLPFSFALRQLYLTIVACGWLAFAGFSIPVSVLEEGDERWYARFVFALRRSFVLARAEFLHALGVMAALLIVVILVGALLIGLLQGLADNGLLAAIVIAQLALAPFLFLSLGVLYLDQRARAISSP
jgi:hypothetical protein